MMFTLTDELNILIPTQSKQVAAVSGSGSPASRAKEERVSVSQWSEQEIKVLIKLRGELEKDFIAQKRNKTLWEVVARKLKERGFSRNADQCKCKWKNLVNRYKAIETSINPENGKQCPFFDELRAIFTERSRNMQQLLLESETSTPTHSKQRIKRSFETKFSDEVSDDYEENNEDYTNRKKPKMANYSLQKLLEDFFQKQQHNESEWRDLIERRDQERRMFENEWRKSMERIERERMMMEQAWHEIEEQRRLREENRALKRDALLNTLLSKLIHENI